MQDVASKSVGKAVGKYLINSKSIIALRLTFRALRFFRTMHNDKVVKVGTETKVIMVANV